MKAVNGFVLPRSFSNIIRIEFHAQIRVREQNTRHNGIYNMYSCAEVNLDAISVSGRVRAPRAWSAKNKASHTGLQASSNIAITLVQRLDQAKIHVSGSTGH